MPSSATSLLLSRRLLLCLLGIGLGLSFGRGRLLRRLVLRREISGGDGGMTRGGEVRMKYASTAVAAASLQYSRVHLSVQGVRVRRCPLLLALLALLRGRRRLHIPVTAREKVVHLGVELQR